MPGLSNPVRVSLITASVGFALIAVLATYLRRRRGRPNKDAKSAPPSVDRVDGYRFPRNKRTRSPSMTRNGDIAYVRQSSVTPLHNRANSVRSQSNRGSNSSLNTLDSTFSDASATTLTADITHLNPGQLCDLGLESLQTAITHWEDALDKLEEEERIAGDNVSLYNAPLRNQLHQLLHRGYNMQDQYEEKMLNQVNANVAMDSAVNALKEMDRAYEDRRRSKSASLQDDTSSDQDSFVSALEVADLSDLEDQISLHQDLILYEAALLELTHGSIPYRTLRTGMVHCSSDTEFLSKLHCIRLALAYLFSEEKKRLYFVKSGRNIITNLLIQADRDPEDFQIAYDNMMDFLSIRENWSDIEDELRGRGVKVMNFYDILIDFIILDAFDDLENPPTSVTSVVQNRWLSNGFKETALSTAVWSVLKAKKRMLRYPKAFIAHFYAISEHTSPVLAWGFLGPESHLKDLSNYFKDQVLAFMRDLFSFEKVRFTTVEQLSDDINRLAKQRLDAIATQMSTFS